MSGQDHSGAGPVNARIFPIPPVVAGLFIAAGFALNWLVPLGGGAPAGPGRGSAAASSWPARLPSPVSPSSKCAATGQPSIRAIKRPRS